MFVNQSAAFSDYHGTGANPAANAALTDAAFVASRFRVVQHRMHVLAMSYENILFESDGGIARLTLNRPDRLNSFTDAMHAEVRDALAQVQSDASLRVLLLTGAGRGFCAGQDLADRAVAPGDGAGRPRRVDRAQLQAAGARAARAADAGRLRGQRRRRRRGRQHRARLRHRHRREVGELHPGVLQDRPDSRCRRHVFPAAPGRDARARWAWRCSGDKLSAEQAAEWGLIWQCVDDAELCATVDALLQQFAAAPTRGARRDQAGAPRSRQATRSKRSSTSSATCSGAWAQRRLREGVAAFLAKRPPQFHGR